MSIVITLLKRGLQLMFALLLIVFLIISALAFYTYYFVEAATAEDAAPDTTRFISFNDEKIATRSWVGTSSTTIVLVGGLSAWSGTWERTVTEQRARGNTDTFIAIDLPPFGYSLPGTSPDYSRIAQAERINAVIDTLNTPHLILIGHSYGGGPISEAALRQPERVTELILISPVLALGAPPRTEPSRVISNDFVRDTAVAAITRIKPFLLRRLDSFVYVKDNISYELLDVYIKPFVVEHTSRKLSDWLYTYLTDNLQDAKSVQIANYSGVSFPITLLWGIEDTLTPIGDSAPLVAGNATIFTLSATGHIPMIEDIEKFNDTLASVLVD